MKINYTSYLANNKVEETNISIIRMMKEAVAAGLKRNNIHGLISVKYYTDGIAQVSINGEYYNCMNTSTGKWFSGFVGDVC